MGRGRWPGGGSGSWEESPTMGSLVKTQHENFLSVARSRDEGYARAQVDLAADARRGEQYPAPLGAEDVVDGEAGPLDLGPRLLDRLARHVRHRDAVDGHGDPHRPPGFDLRA